MSDWRRSKTISARMWLAKLLGNVFQPAPVGMKGLLVNVKSDSNQNVKSLPVAVKKKLK